MNQNSSVAQDPCKELRLLLAFFGESRIPNCSIVAPNDVPEPYHSLLVHDKHMTVTLEQHHDCKVKVIPYQVHRQGDVYGRRLDLLTDPGDRVVLTGIMLLNLMQLAPEVQRQITSATKPLGRILIENDVLRRISSGTYLRFEADDPFVDRFHRAENRPAYGRLATIFCDNAPAIDLLEIVTP